MSSEPMCVSSRPSWAKDGWTSTAMAPRSSPTQAIVDAAAEDGAGLLGDAATLETIGARSEVGSETSAAIDALRAAAESGDFAAAADAVTALLEA